jgi:predicted alpha/beta hydrolase family esterase
VFYTLLVVFVGCSAPQLGPVGHLNPAFGYGDWPDVELLVKELDTVEAPR